MAAGRCSQRSGGSAVGGYERAVGPLSDDEKETFYRDMRVLGTYFGLPAYWAL